MKQQDWLCLVIGNSRLHWAWFTGDTLQETWDTPHLSFHDITFPSSLNTSENLPCYLASVVPTQTQQWEKHPNTKVLTLANIPLQGIYSTMGIDRALALWGAVQTYGFPILVVDGGTALTFTGAGFHAEFVGGAILPGLRSQFQTLSIKTAALPSVNLPSDLPSRWAMNTEAAIESGITYTVLAGMNSFLQDWWRQFPSTPVVFTGGDAFLLQNYLKTYKREIADSIMVDTNLMFWGIRAFRG